MVEPANAWLLEWPLHTMALAPCEVVELVERPEVHRLWFGPQWCQALLRWRDRLIPLALPGDARQEDFSMVTVAFQAAPGAPLEHAALPLSAHPRRIVVPEGCDCEPPGYLPFDRKSLRACFHFDGRVVLVPDLTVLFASAPAG